LVWQHLLFPLIPDFIIIIIGSFASENRRSLRQDHTYNRPVILAFDYSTLLLSIWSQSLSKARNTNQEDNLNNPLGFTAASITTEQNRET
jgi:hypothetical protein